MSRHILQMIMTIGCVLLLAGCGSSDGDRISMDHYPSAARDESGAEELDLEEEIEIGRAHV